MRLLQLNKSKKVAPWLAERSRPRGDLVCWSENGFGVTQAFALFPLFIIFMSNR